MINDYEIPLPRWELSDPFGRAALRSMRYELKKALCERDGYKVEVEKCYKARESAADGLAKALTREQAATDEAMRLYKASEDARKSQGEKIAAMREEINKLTADRARLRIELERLKEEHAQLQVEHE